MIDISNTYFQNNNGNIIFVDVDISEITLINHWGKKFNNELRNVLEVQYSNRGYFYSRSNLNDFEKHLKPLLKKYKLYNLLLSKMEIGLLS